jgi:hypothetical protein
MKLDQIRFSAHRFVWLLERGPIPNGLQVLHKCDNRNCMNPRHFFLGTQSENIIDCTLKGRHPRAKITPEIVKSIRVMCAAGTPQTHVGRMFDLPSSAICNIVHRKRWAYVP